MTAAAAWFAGLGDPTWEVVVRAAASAGAALQRVPVALAAPLNDPRLYADPRILAAVRELLGDDCVLSAFAAWTQPAGAPATAVAPAHPPLVPDADPDLPPFALALWVPLSHTDQPGLEVWADDALVAVPPGASVLLDHRLPRRLLGNPTGQARLWLELCYSCPWFLDAVNLATQPALRMSSAAYHEVPAEHRGLFYRVGSAIAQQRRRATRT